MRRILGCIYEVNSSTYSPRRDSTKESSSEIVGDTGKAQILTVVTPVIYVNDRIEALAEITTRLVATESAFKAWTTASA
jgi:hypothetical protein